MAAGYHPGGVESALQWSFLKRLGDVAAVLLDLVCLSLSFQTDWRWWDQISVWSTGCWQSPCANKKLTGLLQLMGKWLFGNVNWYFRRQSREHTPITIDKTPVERVTSFKFLGVHITEDLTWSAHTDAVLKKAHQRLFFLRRLKKFGTSPRILRSFYTCTVESILTGCITAWFGNSTAGNRRALQRVVRTARHIVGGELPSLQDIYTRRCTRKARRIIKDSSHPSHCLLSLLPSGRRFRSIRSCTSRLRDSFFPQAIRLMNSQK